MDSYGWLSILPPLLAIFLAIKTKHVYVSLTLGIWLGWTIMSHWNPLTGAIQTVNALVGVFANADSTRVILFSAMIGAIITFTQYSGGMKGFINGVMGNVCHNDPHRRSDDQHHRAPSGNYHRRSFGRRGLWRPLLSHLGHDDHFLHGSSDRSYRPCPHTNSLCFRGCGNSHCSVSCLWFCPIMVSLPDIEGLGSVFQEL